VVDGVCARVFVLGGVMRVVWVGLGGGCGWGFGWLRFGWLRVFGRVGVYQFWLSLSVWVVGLHGCVFLNHFHL
jgi:hypothetical protein